MSTSVTIVGGEEVVEAVVTVVRAVGDVFIESAGVIEVGETMVGKNVGKGGAVAFRKIVSSSFFCEMCRFWEHFCVDFAMYNQIYFLTFYYLSDIQ